MAVCGDNETAFLQGEGEPGEGGEPVSNAELRTRFNENIERLKGLILEIIKAVPDERSCGCKDALVDAE